MRIDVEGYETDVLAGAEQTLANPALHALILELNGSGRRYDFDEDAIRQKLRDVVGFTACSYCPFEHSLTPRAETSGGNTLFVRNPNQVETRLRAAPSFRVLGREL